jgi:transposase-like protein
MTKARREFSAEFKREAAGLLESSGRPVLKKAIGIFAEVPR